MGCVSARNQEERPSSGSSSHPSRRYSDVHHRRLVELLKTSKEPVVLAVAAHDVRQYIKYGGDKAKQCV